MNDKLPICYLCGKQILPTQEKSYDHVFQKQFIQRSQPKTKGYKYAGKLPTHLQCNESFGEASKNSESLCKKAMGLIWALWDAKDLISRTKPKVRILGIDVVKHGKFLKTFTLKERKFFGIEGSPYFETQKHLDPNYWRNKDYHPIDPYKKPIEITLSVLTKSAAAFLIKWHRISPDKFWNILVIPLFYHSGNENPRWERVFGNGITLESGINIWVRRWPNNDRVVIYQMDLMTIFFNFKFSSGSVSGDMYIKKWIKNFDFAQNFVFKSNKLKDLVGYEWSKHLIRR